MPRTENETRLTRKPAGLLPWRRILVPIDFSKSSLRALDVAVPLAGDHGAQLFLLSVIEPAAYAAGMEGVVIAVPDATLVKDAKANLPKIAERFIPSSVKFTILVGRGRAFDVITRIAKEKGIDLIVLTTHGRTGIDRVLMGSTAERVVRHAHCPVYVVRSLAQNQQDQQGKD
jgi:nucleotide-binding universal stress UspA family protein